LDIFTARQYCEKQAGCALMAAAATCAGRSASNLFKAEVAAVTRCTYIHLPHTTAQQSGSRNEEREHHRQQAAPSRPPPHHLPPPPRTTPSSSPSPVPPPHPPLHLAQLLIECGGPAGAGHILRGIVHLEVTVIQQLCAQGTDSSTCENTVMHGHTAAACTYSGTHEGDTCSGTDSRTCQHTVIQQLGTCIQGTQADTLGHIWWDTQTAGRVSTRSYSSWAHAHMGLMQTGRSQS
jgi:hypothetical protein